MTTMRSASRDSLATLREQAVSRAAEGASLDQLTGLSDELFAVGGLLTAQPRLRRALADPAAQPDARAALAASVLRARLSEGAFAVVEAAVRQRWSNPWNLADAIEVAGSDLLFIAAEREDVLDEVEDQLFRMQRILGAEGELVGLLDERVVPAERRVALLRELVAGKVHPLTLALLEHAVRSERTRSVELAIGRLIDDAAARRASSVARVLSAAPLSDEQQQRLGAALSELYQRRIDLRVAVEPELQGGLVVRVGDEVIDGSVASRLAKARSALAT